MTTLALASNDPPISSINTNGYNIYDFRFEDTIKQTSQINSNAANKSDKVAQLQQNKKNIQQVINFINDLDFNNLGEPAREAVLQQLQELIQDEIVIKNYRLSLPSVESPYGNYNGYEFRQILTEYESSDYEKDLDDTIDIADWVGFAVDLILGTLDEPLIAVTWSIFSPVLGNNWEVHSGDWVQVIVSETTTTRIILIEDKQNYMPGDFTPVLQQEKKYIDPQYFYHYHSGPGNAEVEVVNVSGRYAYTKNYNNSTSTMREAYGLYSAWQGSYMEVYALPNEHSAFLFVD